MTESTHTIGSDGSTVYVDDRVVVAVPASSLGRTWEDISREAMRRRLNPPRSAIRLGAQHGGPSLAHTIWDAMQEDHPQKLMVIVGLATWDQAKSQVSAQVVSAAAAQFQPTWPLQKDSEPAFFEYVLVYREP